MRPICIEEKTALNRLTGELVEGVNLKVGNDEVVRFILTFELFRTDASITISTLRAYFMERKWRTSCLGQDEKKTEAHWDDV